MSEEGRRTQVKEAMDDKDGKTYIAPSNRHVQQERVREEELRVGDVLSAIEWM